jgi:hypothetical protein
LTLSRGHSTQIGRDLIPRALRALGGKKIPPRNYCLNFVAFSGTPRCIVGRNDSRPAKEK